MLILTRRRGESIRIGDDITITITGINTFLGNQVSLGVSAPKDISIHREEVYIKVKNEEIESLKDKLKNIGHIDSGDIDGQ